MKNKHQHSGKSSESILDKNLILKSLNIKAGHCIFDAGCGNGYMAKEFSRLVGSSGKVYAMDTYEPTITQLKNEVGGSNIVAVLCDITKKTQIEDSSIDLVYMSTVFHGFDAAQADGFLCEVRRVLKKGSILAIVEINKQDTPFGPPMNLRFSPEELIASINLKPKALTRIGNFFYMQTFIN